MANDRNPQWSRHLESIAEELLHLSIACDVRLRDPGVIERIIKDDDTCLLYTSDAADDLQPV